MKLGNVAKRGWGAITALMAAGMLMGRKAPTVREPFRLGDPEPFTLGRKGPLTYCGLLDPNRPGTLHRKKSRNHFVYYWA